MKQMQTFNRYDKNEVILNQNKQIKFTHKIMATAKNSILIQQLCKHIAVIEDLNVKLHEKITVFDQQKELVYRSLGKASWEQLIYDLNEEKAHVRSALQDTSSTCKSKTQWNSREKMVGTQPQFYQTPLKDSKEDRRNDSVYESPIQSQSRLINRSIRGDTDRIPDEELEQQWNKKYSKIMNEKITALNDKLEIKMSKSPTDNFLLTLNNLALNSMSKQNLNLKNTQQQNMLLSIQNTKLRQRVAKLEAIVHSRQIN